MTPRFSIRLLLLVLLFALCAARGQADEGVERLYLLNCGESDTRDVSMWSPGVDVGKPREFSDSCCLICVRYRYDASLRKRFTTVELVVGESPWHPVARKPSDRAAGDLAEQVAVRVGYREESLRQQVKAAGGRWNADRRL